MKFGKSSRKSAAQLEVTNTRQSGLQFNICGHEVNIDWSFWASVIGAVATVVFGIWAILLTKTREYPGQLTYFREPPIRLLDDVTGNLPQITVSYKGDPVQKNLTLLKGFLVNTGSKDITKEMIEKPLSIGLANGYRWLEASAKSPLDGEERAKIIDPKTVVLSLGLFRRDEFLRYEALIEVSEGKKWAGSLWMEHRIADTGDVKWERVPEKPKSLWNEWALPIAVIAVLGGSLLVYPLGGSSTGRTHTFGIVGGIAALGFACLATYIVVSLQRYKRKMRKILKLDSD